MGADMLVACVVFPKDFNFDLEKEKILNSIKTLDEDDIINIYNDVFYEVLEDLEEGRAEVAKAVERGFDVLYNRQTTWIHVGDKIVFLSGGLSWGDAPTDAYEKINALNYIKGYSEL